MKLKVEEFLLIQKINEIKGWTGFQKCVGEYVKDLTETEAQLTGEIFEPIAPTDYTKLIQKKSRIQDKLLGFIWCLDCLEMITDEENEIMTTQIIWLNEYKEHLHH